jgi:hypothetical protein
VVFQTLAATIGASQELWITLDRYHTRRNASEYGGMVEASASDALRRQQPATSSRSIGI